MFRARILSALAGALALGSLAFAADPVYSTVKGQVTYTPPAPIAPVDTKGNPDTKVCLDAAKGPLPDTSIVVDPKTKGFKNVLVFIRPDSTDTKAVFPAAQIKPDLAKAAPKSIVIDQPCCQFEPRMVAARAGDRLEVKNSAAVTHNFNYKGDPNNAAFNPAIAPGKSVKLGAPLAADPAPIQFDCGIHPWMQGRLRVFDHPYFAVTDAEGKFEIAGVPEGKWRIAYFHENGYYKGREGRLGSQIEVKGATTEVKPLEFEFAKAKPEAK